MLRAGGLCVRWRRRRVEDGRWWRWDLTWRCELWGRYYQLGASTLRRYSPLSFIGFVLHSVYRRFDWRCAWVGVFTIARHSLPQNFSGRRYVPRRVTV